MRNRGVTPVIGIGLMIGFTVATALALFATGAVVIDQSQQSVEQDQAEESMVDVAGAVDSTIAGPQEVNEFSFEGAGDRSPVVKENTGQLRVVHNGSNLYDERIGAFVFEHGNTEYAYQGGAVWRVDGDGDARMVRTPQVHYNFRTLTVPLINITGEVTAGSQRGQIRFDQQTRIYPEEDSDPNPLEGGTVAVEVQSDRYCGGWEQYFESLSEGELDEYCDQGTPNQVIIEFAVPLVIDEVDEGVKTGDYDGHNTQPEDHDEVEEDENFEAASADGIIEDRRSDCAGEPTEDGSMTITDAGLYCFDDSEDLDITVDTDQIDGDEVDIYVNGSPEVDAIDVGDDTSPPVNVYFDGGTVTYGGSDVMGNHLDSSQTVLFFHSSTDFQQTGNGDIYALMYAPDSTIDFQSSGSEGLDGGIIAEKVEANSANAENNLEYSEDLDGFDREFSGAGEPFYFLHIVETEIVFEG